MATIDKEIHQLKGCRACKAPTKEAARSKAKGRAQRA